MMEANVDPYNLGLHNLSDCLKRLELVDGIQKQAQGENPNVQQHKEVKRA
jgi:hypothetical protein